MTLKRREYHVDCRAKKAAIFFMACEQNPATRVKIPDAMRIKGVLPKQGRQSSAADAGALQGGENKRIGYSWPSRSCGHGRICAAVPGIFGDDGKAGISNNHA
jgi:hypothetical protein